MDFPQDSIRKLQPDFLIPVGTQVVLKVAKPVAAGDVYRPAGSVGVVIEAPPDNKRPYVVRFGDGSVVRARFEELAIRRREVEDALGEIDEDLRPYIIYRCQVGSKAYGLGTDESDDDIRGVYLPPARLHWSLRALPEQLEFEDEHKDEVYWEIEKYLRLALKSNPNVLETLWTPLVLQAAPLAQQLREMRRAFLSKHLYKTYSGYVLSQFRRMAKAFERTGTFKTKHAMHLVRLLYSGIGAMTTGEIPVDVSDHREELLQIRCGAMSFEEVKQRAFQLERRFEQAFQRTSLPEHPDFERVDAFLVRARRSMVDA